MTTNSTLPHPDNCEECLKARNCETKTFESHLLQDPIPQPNQSLKEYLENLCQCGQQIIIAFEERVDDSTTIPHTTVCIEHSIHWMAQIIDLKMRHERGDL